MTYDSVSSAPRVAYATLLEIMFPDDPLRVFNGVGRLPWGELTFLGLGDLGELSEITGGSDLEAADVRATLSGIPSDYRSYLLNTVARGVEVNIYSGFWNEATGAWSLEPELDYAGFIESAEVSEAIDEAGASSLAIEVTFISAAAFSRRVTLARRTASHQKAAFPGDEFYSFLTDMRAGIPTIRGFPNLLSALVPRSEPNAD